MKLPTWVGALFDIQPGRAPRPDGPLGAEQLLVRRLEERRVFAAPVLTTSGGSTGYTENSLGAVIDSGLTLSDADSANLASATVRITDFVSGQDSLLFTNQNGISGAFAAGTLTLTGSSSVANYQAALRSVQYTNSSDGPSPLTRNIEFIANDGTADSAAATKGITITPTADTPSVTNATTNEDTQSTSGLVISRNAADGAEVTHFKITGITDGSLYKNDGITEIQDNDFITFAEANAGLKFTPSPNFSGTATFLVRASTSNADAGLGGSAIAASITVNAAADTPTVTNASTTEDVQTTSGLVITKNAADGAEVTHYQITNIQNGTLFRANGNTVINAGDFITDNQAAAGLKFTPSAGFSGNASFQIQASTSNTVAGLGGGLATATITVAGVANTPSVTNASTNEDTQTSSGLVISRNASDGAEVTHFKITSITNGTLFQNNGTTVIANGDFITFAQANAGLKFTPTANFFGSGSFQIQASLSNTDAGLGGSVITATITVAAVADTPSVTNASTNEDTITTSGLVVSRNAADGAEVTHFQITNITNGTLFQNDGVTAIANGSFITFAQANAGLRFRPSANFFGSGSFDVQASTSNVAGGLGGSVVTATITVAPVADSPFVTGTITNEDTQSTAGLTIQRNLNDGAEVTHFKITGIVNGALFQNDGVTAIASGDFITAAQAAAGLKFTPAADFHGATSFNVQASLSNVDSGLGGAVVAVPITVTPIADTPSVTNASTNEDQQTTSGLVVSRNPVDGAEITHFRITNITNGALFLNDGVTAVANGTFITFAQANAGLKFTPSANFFGSGSFDVQASTSNAAAGLGGGIVTATITVAPVADTPSVTNATTNEDTQSTSGLVVSRNAADGAEVTHFRITNIQNGALFQNDGVTAIASGDFITFAQANAGLKFTPSPNFNSSSGVGSFDVQASLSNLPSGLGGSVATAIITVNAVNDPPVLLAPANEATLEDTPLTFSIPNGNAIQVNDVDAAGGSIAMTLTAANGRLTLASTAGITFSVGSANGTKTLSFSGTLAAVNTALNGLIYSPDLNFNGPDAILVSVSDNGNTGAGGPQADNAIVGLSIAAVNDPPVVNVPSIGAQNEGSPLNFGINVSDVDNDLLTVTLAAPVGNLTLANVTGLTFINGTANGDRVLEIQGLATDVQAALTQISFLHGDNGLFPVAITVTDPSGPAVVGAANLQLMNVAPTPLLSGGSNTGFEGSVQSMTGSATDPGTLDTITFTWTVTKNGAAFSAGAGPAVNFTPDNQGAYLVRLRATDDDGGFNETTFGVTIANVAPTVSGSGTNVDASRITFITINVDDPGSDTITIRYDWGDLLPDDVVVLSFGPGSTPGPRLVPVVPHTYVSAPNPRDPLADITVVVTISDDTQSVQEIVIVSVVGQGLPVFSLVPAPVIPQIQVAQTVIVLDRPVIEVAPQVVNQTTRDAGVQSEAVEEEHQRLLLRVVAPDGDEGPDYVIDLGALDDLPGFFNDANRRLPDGHYRVYLQQAGTLRLVIDTYLRRGRLVDPQDASDAELDRPPSAPLDKGGVAPAAASPAAPEAPVGPDLPGSAGARPSQPAVPPAVEIAPLPMLRFDESADVETPAEEGSPPLHFGRWQRGLIAGATLLFAAQTAASTQPSPRVERFDPPRSTLGAAARLRRRALRALRLEDR